MTFVIEIILAALIHDPHQIIFGRSQIRKNPIDLAGEEGRLVIRVVYTKSERFLLWFHPSSNSPALPVVRPALLMGYGCHDRFLSANPIEHVIWKPLKGGPSGSVFG